MQGPDMLQAMCTASADALAQSRMPDLARNAMLHCFHSQLHSYTYLSL